MRLGQHMTDESKAKISVANTGRILSAEDRINISVTHKGKPKSAEWRAKLSVAMTGKHPLPVSLEARAKMSISHWKGGRQVANAKHTAKRRVLGFVPLNSPFMNCEAHHINQSDVIYIPKELHQSVRHNQWTGKGMAEMNALAGRFLTEDWT